LRIRPGPVSGAPTMPEGICVVTPGGAWFAQLVAQDDYGT
jgi:hypothetical protein